MRALPLFFFQAEDGIRDRTVTGVQTCALPILDDWGKVVGFIDAGTADSREAVVVPLSRFADVAASVNSSEQAMYVGPPLIRTASVQLVLGPSYFGNRSAKQDLNEVSYAIGSLNSSYIRGDLWVGTYPSIASA